MNKTKTEHNFEQYREYIRQEASRLSCYIALYQRLHELRNERLDEMNLAPAFFHTVIDALFSVIVIWVHKMFDDNSERGLLNFLIFCENNIEIFKLKELQRRNNYPDGHWMLKDRKPVTIETINEDNKRIRNLKSLPSFKLRRDKFHAHFDKKYFFDRKRLIQKAPLKWSDLNQVIEIIKDIINAYSADYDGNLFALEPLNVTDVDYLLDRLHNYKNGA